VTDPPPAPSARWRIDAAVLAVGGAMILAFGLRLALLARPIARLDRGFIPDDTYYTLTIARSIAHGHGPTADGTTLTSGFQPLLGFLMIPVYWVTNNLDLALRLDLFLLIVVDTLIVAILAWVAFRLAGRVAAVVAAAIWAVSPVATTMALGGLETSLALLCEIGLVAAYIWANDRSSTRRWLVVGVIAGLAVLARVDALLLVGLLTLIQFWRGPRKALVPASIAGVLTLAPWWGWCAIELGTPVPTSGTALHRLATYAPFSPHNLALVAGAVSGGPFGNPTALRTWLDDAPARGTVLFVALVASLLAIAFAWLRRALLTCEAREGADRSVGDRSNAYAAAAAMPVFAVGLLFFYAWFGVWYFNTRYLAPVQIGLTLAISVFISRLARERRRRARIGFVVLAGAFGIAMGAAVVYDAAMLRGDAPSSHLTLDAATGFRRVAREATNITPKGSVVAAYQSGALGYFGNGRITAINLDGVVDPNAPSPSVPADTLRYMQRRNVRWLAEWGVLVHKLVTFDPRSDIAVSAREVARFEQLPYVDYRVLQVTRYWHPRVRGAPGPPAAPAG
jgi:hypothetical protein